MPGDGKAGADAPIRRAKRVRTSGLLDDFSLHQLLACATRGSRMRKPAVDGESSTAPRKRLPARADEKAADFERQRRIALPAPDDLQHQVDGRQRACCGDALAVDDETVLDGSHLRIGQREILEIFPMDRRRHVVEKACFLQATNCRI